MKFNMKRFFVVIVAVTCPSVLWACREEADENTPAAAVEPAESANAAARAEAVESHGHEHGDDAEKSDLDRPIPELLAMTCEHGIRTYLCDECRYETGFVRVTPALSEGGLLTTATVERRRVAVPIPLTGEVRFDERRVGHVSTQVEGIIRKVLVALGDPVKAGQPLVEIESVVVGEGQAAWQEAEGLLSLARRNFERVSALRGENIASEREFLEAKQELDAAQIRADAARGRLNRLGTGGVGGGRIVLRAPLDGTVLLMHAVSGELARTEEPLVTVGDNTAVWVWADLYERDIAAVKAGQAAGDLAASVSVKAYPGVEFPGRVDLVSPAMDEWSRTVKLRVVVPNSDGRLLAGMFATVSVFLPGADEALAVPRDAVLEDEGRSFVFVRYDDEYFVRRAVGTGRSWDGFVEITKGLELSQVVAADGAFLLKSDVLRSKMGAGCAD